MSSIRRTCVALLAGAALLGPATAAQAGPPVKQLASASGVATHIDDWFAARDEVIAINYRCTSRRGGRMFLRDHTGYRELRIICDGQIHQKRPVHVRPGIGTRLRINQGSAAFMAFTVYGVG